MSLRTSRFAGLLAAAAAASLVASPAVARGWGGGWGGWGHHDHDIDAGDVFAGLLVLGGIVAIASAASSASKQASHTPDHAPPPPSRDGYGYGASNDSRPQWHPGIGIDSAVNHCTDEVAHAHGSVDQVETVNRDGDGWRVGGRANGGGTFACVVDGAGQIRSITINGRAI